MQNSFSPSQPLFIKMLDDIDEYSILFLDTEGNIGSWNKGAEKIKGYSAHEIVGKNFRLLYDEESRNKGIPELLLEEARSKGKVQQQGWRLKKNGDLFWAHITITAIYDDDQELIGFSKFTKDLTEKMMAEKALKAYARELEIRNKELEQFVYIASHDLQEPLLNLNNFVGLLRAEYGGLLDEDGELYLNYIHQSSERMQSLIKGLLDYARLGAHQPKNIVDCNQVLDDLKIDLQHQIESLGAEIYYENLPVLNGYETPIRQLFQNLINNALKFRKEDVVPKIHISAYNDDQFWHFEVRDNGIGIEERYLQKVFVIFQRLHSQADYEGHGIGLSHCKKIVELHGGEISVQSTPGVGSRFCFTLKNNIL